MLSTLSWFCPDTASSPHYVSEEGKHWNQNDSLSGLEMILSNGVANGTIQCSHFFSPTWDKLRVVRTHRARMLSALLRENKLRGHVKRKRVAAGRLGQTLRPIQIRQPSVQSTTERGRIRNDENVSEEGEWRCEKGRGDRATGRGREGTDTPTEDWVVAETDGGLEGPLGYRTRY